MTIRLSTGLAIAMLNGNTTGGVKGSLNLGFIAIYTGAQPGSADTAASGTLLGTVTVNDAGTGLTFDLATTATINKAAAETWRFHGLTAGTAGWFRHYPAAGNPANTSLTEARIDGSIGTSGADMNISNTSIVLSAITTIDTYSFTMPQV